MRNLNKQCKISIIGMGYVGLPLAEKLSKYYNVIGFDNNVNRINSLKNNLDYNSQITFSKLNKKKITFTFNEKDLLDSNIFIITVPTPIYKNKNPDLSYLLNATKIVASYLKKIRLLYMNLQSFQVVQGIIVFQSYQKFLV